MLNFLSILFNPYGRTAWLQPIMWTLLPVVVAGILLIPWLQTTWKAVFSAAASCGLLTLVMHVGRHTGKKAQDDLFAMWDGKPSAAMLRHRDTRIRQITKDRYRSFLERSVPMLKLASPEEESADADRAEDGYESATSWLLAQTRDRGRFGLLLAENTELRLSPKYLDSEASGPGTGRNNRRCRRNSDSRNLDAWRGQLDSRCQHGVVDRHGFGYGSCRNLRHQDSPGMGTVCGGIVRPAATGRLRHTRI